MTREEAIEVLRTTVGFTKDDAFTPNWVDAFDRLGMLKLNEPKNIDRILNDICGGIISSVWLRGRLEEAGLKIVEK